MSISQHPAHADWLAPGETLALDEAGHLLIVRAGAVPLRAELRPAPMPEQPAAPVATPPAVPVWAGWRRLAAALLPRRAAPAVQGC